MMERLIKMIMKTQELAREYPELNVTIDVQGHDECDVLNIYGTSIQVNDGNHISLLEFTTNYTPPEGYEVLSEE